MCGTMGYLFHVWGGVSVGLFLSPAVRACVSACVRACVRALVSHADSSKTTTATDFYVS